jgi:hypothetical protein
LPNTEWKFPKILSLFFINFKILENGTFWTPLVKFISETVQDGGYYQKLLYWSTQIKKHINTGWKIKILDTLQICEQKKSFILFMAHQYPYRWSFCPPKMHKNGIQKFKCQNFEIPPFISKMVIVT